MREGVTDDNTARTDVIGRIYAGPRTYVCIDLKTFHASVECSDRNLDALATDLVVANPTRTEKTICRAVSPSLKVYGIPGRARAHAALRRPGYQVLLQAGYGQWVLPAEDSGARLWFILFAPSGEWLGDWEIYESLSSGTSAPSVLTGQNRANSSGG